MKRILIVNDVPSVNRLLAHNFESEGFCVDAVLTGTEGIVRARDTRYDIILLDYKLPDINGDKVCMAIKGEEGLKDVPVYFISSLDKDAMNKVIADTGAQGYLDIAVEVGELIEQIKNAIGD